MSFEPIAIIGLGCRFPGECNDPESYWRLLVEGGDAISTTPADRWSLDKFYVPGEAKPGKTNSKWGGYVDGIGDFDPDLFGISPREAASMDPQQRMLLEVAYRAAEDAGKPIESLAGKSVSVHVGISSVDYSVAGLSFRDRGVISPYSNTGGSSSIAANRISYCFDLRGESVAVDTACSSSLLATHLACQSLQNRRHQMAFAGGVNALLLPDYYVAFSQLGVLSPDGRCKTFDASANGYVRSEGAGMVLLKRLRDAIQDGDSIYAVIRASATNQDGRTEGMTVPSQEAQESLIRAALSTANLDASDVSYVEAHGTGTAVGDPIEARAIASCYGGSRQDTCHMASVKTNIGHLEAGAGIASIIKVALSLRHATIPSHLHLKEINPKIQLGESGLLIPTRTIPWQANGIRVAGINGFGYGGANAHLILGEVGPELPSSLPRVKGSLGSKGTNTPRVLPISAHSQAALAQTAKAWAHWLEDAVETDSQIAASAAKHRSHHNHRAAIVGVNRESWIRQLRELAAAPGEHSKTVQTRLPGSDQEPPTAFVCSGQGPQWWAMGRGLIESSDVFRDTMEACDREFAKYVRWSLLEEFVRDETRSRMNETAIAQPSIFALQVALAAVWRQRGVVPNYLVGHSVGEIAAAHLCGSLTFQDACCVAVHRGRTMDAASSKGAMIAVGLSQAEMSSWIEGIEDRVSIAAINGPASLTVSGCHIEIGRLKDKLDQAGVFCRQLQVEYAFHSQQMDPVKDELLRSLAGIRPVQPHTPMISTVTGDWITADSLDGEYWWQNVRQCVRFADAMNVLSETDCRLAIEIGPHPVLAYAIAECFGDKTASIKTVGSLRRDVNDVESMAKAVGQLYVDGFPVDWQRCVPESQACFVKLPRLAMQKQALWFESLESTVTRLSPRNNRLLGDRIEGADPVWEGRVDLKLQSELAGHRVRQSCVLPAAALLEVARAAASESLSDETPGDTVSLQRFRLQHPCLLSDDIAQRIQTRFDASRRRIHMASSSADESDWKTLATVDTSSAPAAERRSDFNFQTLVSELEESISSERLYRHCEELGLNYGRQFRGVTEAQRSSGHAVVTVDLPQEGTGEWGMPPAVLDSCFHGMIVADPDFEDAIRGLYLPQQIRSIDIFGDLKGRVTADVRIIRKDDYRMVADIDVFDSEGEHLIAIRGFESACVSGTSKSGQSIEPLIYRYVWKPAASTTPHDPTLDPARKWLVFTDQTGMGQALIGRLPVGDTILDVQHGANFKRLGDRSFIIDPGCREDFQRLLSDVGDGITDIVYLWGLDVPDNAELSDSSLEKSGLLTTLAPMQLVQAWESAYTSKRQSTIARLALVTGAAQPPDETMLPITMATSPLIGFGRVIANECGRLATRLIDLHGSDAVRLSDLNGELVGQFDVEDEVMYRDSIRWVRRFVPTAEQPIHHESERRTPCQLMRDESASIDGLRYRTCSESPLASDQVRIQVIASGLNFSDVMKALDLYPGLPDGPVKLGAECSGRVTEIGGEVTEFCVGDEVVAIAPGAFASHVQVQSCMVAKKPTNLSHSEAATIPVAFLTANYALNECARIREGESVLIHAASGGVGIAATQLGRLAGATVFATAGTEKKREFVREAGVEHVMDSRSLDFAAETMESTAGVGVDVILNSLPGEAISKGMSILKTGGRFLEIGKRDIYADMPLGLEPFRNNLALFAIDLDQLFREQPRRMGDMLRALMPRFESGELRPLPDTVFDCDETANAFRWMQQGKHIGKVVLQYDKTPERVFAGEVPETRIKSDRTYWLAGGLGGFGMRIAEWMIQQGAKHLVLGGRRQTVAEETRVVLDRWAEQGVSVYLMPVDLTRMQSVQKVVDQIDDQCPPLAGVIHTAMILEDRLLVDLDRDTLTRVLGPKVLGGWNLHAATSEYDLDLFVLFSSLSSVFGHAGQANYAAANAFLDSLAHYRRAIGMPAVAINWGHVGEVGYLAAREELSQRLERQGVLSFTAEEATRCLEYALGTDAIQQSVLKMDWTLWRGLGITGEVSPKFAHLVRDRGDQIRSGGRLATAGEVREAAHDQRHSLIQEIVADKASKLLGVEASEMEWEQPLLTMGLDSLMAVEMRNWIENQLEIDLPISDLMRGESLTQVCRVIADIVAGPSTTAKVSQSESDATEELLGKLPEMSDDEVDQLLSQMLDQPSGEE